MEDRTDAGLAKERWILFVVLIVQQEEMTSIIFPDHYPV